MPEENRVFDVAKPGHSSPEATSKPVIVGHQPTTSDPMVRDVPDEGPTKIMVHEDNHLNASEEHTDAGAPAIMDPKDEPTSSPFAGASDQSLVQMSDESKSDWPGPSSDPEPNHEMSDPKDEPSADGEHPTEGDAPASDTHGDNDSMPPLGHVEELHFTPARRGFSAKLAILVVLVLLIGAYLLIDSGKLGSGINLPFHVFKQKSNPPAVQTPAASPSQPKANTVTVPSGFTEYKLAGTTITFAAPTAWGQPTSNTDQGFSSRSATAKSDGTYAYLVDFATNKDVEVAVTSSKYLPTSRTALYYDFLQWCTGTNDSKYYLQTLHYTTSTDKVDTPATVVCDFGPIVAQKLDASTLYMSQVKGSDGKTVIGDLYIKNLNSSDLTVLRVKDATAKNTDDIKKLLGTVKSPTGTAVAATQ